ncbi:unnamed protein product, partial [Rotaria magnacalcarata]
MASTAAAFSASFEQTSSSTDRLSLLSEAISSIGTTTQGSNSVDSSTSIGYTSETSSVATISPTVSGTIVSRTTAFPGDDLPGTSGGSVMDATSVDGAENVVTTSEIRTSPGSVLHSFMDSSSVVTAINISNASMNFTTHAESSSSESTLGRSIPVTLSSSSEYSISFGETATRFSSEYVNGMNEQLTVVNSQDQTSMSTISPRAETNTNQVTVDNSFLTDAPNNGAVFVTSITPTTRSLMQSSLLTYSDSVSNIRTITPTSTNAMNIITSVEQVSEDRSSSTFNMKYTTAELTEFAINFGDESAVPDSDTTHSKMTDTTTNQDSSTNAPVTITSTIASVEYSSSEQITSFTSETMVSSRTTISDSAAYVQNESSSSTSAISSSSMDTTDHTTFLSDTDSLTTESFKSTDTTLSTSQNQLQSTAEEYKSEETTSSTISSILLTDTVTMSSAIEVTTRSNTIPSSVSEQSITDRTTLDSSTYLYSSTQKVIDETSTSTMSIMNTDQSSILASTISPSNVTATVEMMSSIDVELSSSQ